MQQPRFWNSVNFISLALLPFAFLYNLVSKINLFLQGLFAYCSNKFVISVGNVNIGGTGKSQFVLSLVEKLSGCGLKVAVVMRGYNGKLSCSKNAVMVDSNIHSFFDVGDEALMIDLKSNADVFINCNRKLCMNVIDKADYDVVVMDDAMQNNSVKKDFSVCIFDGVNGIKNGFVIPAGPLRESLYTGVKKSDAFIIVRDDKTNLKQKLIKNNVDNKNIFNADIISDFNFDKTKFDFNSNIVAFCSIGEPEKFFHSLKKFGFKNIDEVVFSDHYNYSELDIQNIINSSVDKYGNDVLILTTDKDYVKIPLKYRNFIKNFSVKLDIMNFDSLIKTILQKIKSKV